jgi:hypothetical protein
MVPKVDLASIRVLKKLGTRHWRDTVFEGQPNAVLGPARSAWT